MLLLNFIFFTLTTVVYFTKLKSSTSTDYQGLGIYVTVTILLQFIANLVAIFASCGSLSSDSMGAAGLITFGYWLILVMAIAALTSFPGLKSAFADVFGYLVVRNEANELLTSMLSGNQLAEVTKLLGNKSLIINELTPDNFNKVWTEGYMTLASGDNVAEKSTRLRQLMETRDSVGEAMWYIYTGIFVTLFVDMKIKLRGCMSSQAAMQQQYADFKNSEKN